MITKTIKFLNSYPKLIILFTLALTALFTFQIQENLFEDGSLKIDSSMEPFIGRGSGAYD